MTGIDSTSGLPSAALKQYVARECKAGVVDSTRREAYMAVDITEAVSHVLHTRSLKGKGWKKGVTGLTVSKDDITWVVMPLCMEKVEQTFVQDATSAILLAEGAQYTIATREPVKATKPAAEAKPVKKAVAKKVAKKVVKAKKAKVMDQTDGE